MTILSEGAAAIRYHAAPRFWSMVACPRCAGVVVIETTGNGGEVGVLSTMPAGRQEVIADLPDDVANYFRGAQTVLEAGVPDAAAVQLRRALEAAAAHYGVTSGPLITRIRKLIELGLITKNFSLVLHHVREVGNVGAHASDQTVDDETARRAMRFTTQVLRNLFEIPAELQRIGPGAQPGEAVDDLPREV